MTAGDRQWPGFHADREPERMEQERQHEQEIKARNLSARIQAADPAARDRIDPAIGRTFGDCAERGLYDDDSRVQSFRGQRAAERDTRERFRWTQARVQGRRGRN